MTRLLTCTLLIVSSICSLYGQRHEVLTMEETIKRAQVFSIDAMVAKNTFISNYWSYRSFKAEQLPSLNLSANLLNFDRSQRALQDATTGAISYRDNNNMRNTASISLDQKIFATGGTLSLYSSLSRLDQYDPLRQTTYYSQPITLSYLQPLKSFNSYKWMKKIEPLNFEAAKKSYIESMEGVTIKAVQLFFNYIIAENNYTTAVSNYENTKLMYDIAAKRFSETGSVRHADLLQLELRMLNDSLSITSRESSFRSSQIALKSFLGYSQDTKLTLVADPEVPNIEMGYGFVLEKALANGSFTLNQQIKELNAKRDVASAKGNKGMSISINTQFGLSNSADEFKYAYRNLIEQEIVGLSLKIPILDWGMGRGRVKMAEYRLKIAESQIEQATMEFHEQIYNDISQFNTQKRQLILSLKARDISDKRYELTMKNFANGMVSVTELNTAQSEKESANMSYISQLSSFWNNYFNLRKTSLYDFITNTDISAEYDKLIE